MRHKALYPTANIFSSNYKMSWNWSSSISELDNHYIDRFAPRGLMFSESWAKSSNWGIGSRATIAFLRMGIPVASD